jgi:hypothetical protein
MQGNRNCFFCCRYGGLFPTLVILFVFSVIKRNNRLLARYASKDLTGIYDIFI